MEATEEVREGASQLRPVEAKAGEAQEEAGAAPVLASVDAPAAGSADGAPSVAEADLAVAAEGAPAGPDRPAAKGAASDSPVTLPLSNVLKCVKASTPMLQTREAKDLFSRSAAIFTVFLSSSANDICRTKKRSAMKADDVVAALHDVGMGELANEVRGALGNQKRAAQAAGKRKRESPGGVQAAQVTGAADVLAPGEAAALG